MASRKTRREARVERITWFLMILVFIFVSFDEQVQIADYVVPIALGLILLFSGIYQYFREGWRVSPVVWMVSALCLAYGGFIIYSSSRLFIDPILFGFVATVVVILFGIITNEG